jgi:hypothetical protein
MKMNKAAFPAIVSVLISLVAASVLAGTETIIPQDTVGLPNNAWSTNSLGGKVVSVTDGDDDFYIYAEANLFQGFTLTDETTIPGDATIDSFVVVFRAQKTSASLTRIRVRVRMDGTTTFCDGSNTILTTSWVDYRSKFTATPTEGTGTCGETITKARIDSLYIVMVGVTTPIGEQSQVTDIDVIVYFTEVAGESQPTRRRKLLQVGSAPDGEQYYAFYKPTWLWEKI